MKNSIWKSKLTSRKFWTAVVGFVSPLLLSLGMQENKVAQVAAIITAGGTLIAYIVGEGMVDAAREGKADAPGSIPDDADQVY